MPHYYQKQPFIFDLALS